MSTTSLDLPVRSRCLGICQGVLTLLVLAVGASWLEADENDLRDLHHEVMVRAALAKDPDLGPLNLVVRVKNRVATLSGSVPSRAAAQHALTAAKSVSEIQEVKDKLTVLPRGTGLASALKLPPAKASALPAGEVLPVIATLPPVDVPKPQQSLLSSWIPLNPASPQGQTHDVALLPPVASEPPPHARDSADKKPALPPDATAITSAVQSLLQAEERYRRLRFEVKDGKVHLSGAVQRWPDLEDLARATARIPGVDGVVAREVKVDAVRK